jgi:hypothetical protein
MLSLVSGCLKWYNGAMIVNVAGKDNRRKCVALLVCLFVAANSVQGTVLCFGADGHVKFESAFHEQCTDHDHPLPADHTGHSETGHESDRHCHRGPCVDVPIDVGLAKVLKTDEQLDRASAAVDTDAILAVEQPGSLEPAPPSSVFFATSYFSPLRTIILLA